MIAKLLLRSRTGKTLRTNTENHRRSLMGRESVSAAIAPDGPIISFHDVHKHFGSHHVLRGISLDVGRGEVIVIAGPSGSGKTTLIRCVNKLESISSGQLVVDDVHVESPATDVNRLRTEIGMVFQQFNLFPHLTVLDNIALAPIRVRRVPRRRAEEEARALLARVGIAEK